MESEETLAVQIIVLVQPPMVETSLRETLNAVRAAPVARRVVALGGTDGEWLPAGFDLIGQHGGGYGERVAAVLADAYATATFPMLLVRPDVSRITPDVLADAAWTLASGEADAAYGPSHDGGFWLLGLSRPDRSLVLGLPGPHEGGEPGGRLLLDRLASARLRVALAPRLHVARAPAFR